MIGMLSRLLVLMLALCSIAIGISQYAGIRSQETALIAYHVNEGETYTLYIKDTHLGLQVWLAGTRCFKALPPWAYIDTAHGAPDTGYDYLQAIERVEALELLFSCE